MKLSFSISVSPNKSKYAPYLFGQNFEEAFQKASELGFNGVEIAVRDPEDMNLDNIKHLLNKYELEVSAIATGQGFTKDGLSFINKDPKIREEAVKRFNKSIKLAREFNTYVIIGGIRGISDENISDNTAAERIKECLFKVSEEANKHSIDLLFEPINRYETTFGNSLAESLEFVRSLDCHNIKIMADTYHMNIEDVSFYDPVIEAGSLLQYVHFCDSNRMAVGYGNLNLQEFFKALKKINYQGYLCAEILPKPDSGKALEETYNSYMKYV